MAAMDLDFEQKGAILERCGAIFLKKIRNEINDPLFMARLVEAGVLDGDTSQDIQAVETPGRRCNVLLMYLQSAAVDVFITFCIVLHDQQNRSDIVHDFGLNIDDLRLYIAKNNGVNATDAKRGMQTTSNPGTASSGTLYPETIYLDYSSSEESTDSLLGSSECDADIINGTQRIDPSTLHTKSRGSTDSLDQLMSNMEQAGLTFYGRTASDGNCFFEAISYQLDRLRCQKKSPLELRKEVVSYIRNNQIIEGQEGEVNFLSFTEGDKSSYCDKMAKEGTWADHVVVLATAMMLQRDIHIVTSVPDSEPDKAMTRIVGKEGYDGPPLLLGHVHELHYESLRPKEANATVHLDDSNKAKQPKPKKIKKKVISTPLIFGGSSDSAEEFQRFCEVLPLIIEHCENCVRRLMKKNLYGLKDDPSAEPFDTSTVWIDVNPLCDGKKKLKPISERDILQPFDNLEAPRTTRLYGPPGGGKSLLEEHIVYEWAKEFLEKAKRWGNKPKSWKESGLTHTMMVYVPTRMITEERELNDIIHDCLWCKEEKDRKRLFEYVKHGYGVVEFLDALDEIRLDKVQQRIKTYVEERSKRGGAQVLVSARTDRCMIDACAFDRFLSLPGFTEDQYQRYIKTYLSEYEKVDEVVQCIKEENHKLQPILKNPLHLHILCALISKGKLCTKALKDLSRLRLFKILVDFLKEREGDRLSGEDIQRFYKLCLFEILIGIREFDEKVIRDFNVPNHCAAFMERSWGIPGTKTKWSFPHETMQECFAGCYFENLPEKELKFFLLSICFKPDFWNLQRVVAGILLQMGGEHVKLLKTMIRCILVSQHRDTESDWYWFKAFFSRKNHYDILDALQSDISKIVITLNTNDALWQYLEGEVEHGDVEDIWKRLDKVFDEEVDAFRKAQWYHGLTQGVIDHVKLCLEGCPEELRADIMENTVNHLLPKNDSQVTSSWILGSRRIIPYVFSDQCWAELVVWPTSLLHLFTGHLKVHAWSPDEAKKLIEEDTKSNDCSKKDKIARSVRIKLNQFRDLRGTPPNSTWAKENCDGLVKEIKKRWSNKKVIIRVEEETPLAGLLKCFKEQQRELPEINVKLGKIHHKDLTKLIKEFESSSIQLKSTTVVVPDNQAEVKKIMKAPLLQKNREEKLVLLDPVLKDTNGKVVEVTF